jgi:uncharacterized protein involved in tolerance to divalent cations
MRSLIILLIISFAASASSSEEWRKKWERDMEIRRYFSERNLDDIRKNIDKESKYRDVSISDIEIREITKDFESYFEQEINDSLVSIGAVTEGCDCDGDACTNQVFISYQSEFILFSKISNKWQVSPVYKWNKQYKELYDKLYQRRTADEEIKLQEQINEMIESAPECKDEA